MIKVITTAILFVCISLQGQSKIDDTLKLKIDIKLDNVTVQEALEMIQKKSRLIDPDKKGLNIIIQEKDAKKLNKKIKFDFTDIPIGAAMWLLRNLSKRVGILT